MEIAVYVLSIALVITLISWFWHVTLKSSEIRGLERKSDYLKSEIKYRDSRIDEWITQYKQLGDQLKSEKEKHEKKSGEWFALKNEMYNKIKELEHKLNPPQDKTYELTIGGDKEMIRACSHKNINGVVSFYGKDNQLVAEYANLLGFKII